MQRLQPLDEIKIHVVLLLSMEKNPVTSSHLRERLREVIREDIDPREYGCSTFDDLLCSLTEDVQYSMQNGTLLFMAKPISRNNDRRELVARQNNPRQYHSMDNLYNYRRNLNTSYSNSYRSYPKYDNSGNHYFKHNRYSEYNNNGYSSINDSMNDYSFTNINNLLRISKFHQNFSNDELIRRMIKEIKQYGDLPFDDLNHRLTVIVNHSCRIFKVYLNDMGKAFVKLIEDESNSNIAFKFGNLRDAWEYDFCWLDSQKNYMFNSRNEFNVYVICFIPPRGLLIIPKTDTSDLEKEDLERRLHEISEAIKQSDTESKGSIKPECIVPGQALGWLSKNFFFRVIVLSGTIDSYINVVLVDYLNKYVTCVRMDQLYELPNNAGFNSYEPNTKFCSLAGIEICDELMQEKLNYTFDGYFSTVPAYITCDRDKIMIDILFINELNEYEWLTSILKKNGSDVSDNVELPVNYYSNNFMENVYTISGSSMILQFFEEITYEDGEIDDLFHQEVQAEMRELCNSETFPTISSQILTEPISRFSTTSSSSERRNLIPGDLTLSEIFGMLIDANQPGRAISLYGLVDQLALFSPHGFTGLKYHLKKKIGRIYGIDV